MQITWQSVGIGLCRFGANTAAARAQAVAGSATDRMRESFAAMKNLNLGFSRKSEGM